MNVLISNNGLSNGYPTLESVTALAVVTIGNLQNGLINEHGHTHCLDTVQVEVGLENEAAQSARHVNGQHAGVGLHNTNNSVVDTVHELGQVGDLSVHAADSTHLALKVSHIGLKSGDAVQLGLQRSQNGVLDSLLAGNSSSNCLNLLVQLSGSSVVAQILRDVSNLQVSREINS